MAFGGSGGSSNAIPARSPPQKNDYIAWLGPFPADVGGGGGSYHRAALQALCYIILVINLRHMAGGKTDLVAIGGIPRRRRLTQLPLGQLALHGLFKGGPGIPRSGKTHGLMDKYPA